MNPLAVMLVALLGVYAAFFVLARAERLAVLLVLSMFVTRLSGDVGGLTFRPEMFGGILAVISLLTQRGERRIAVPSAISIAAVLTWLAGGILSSALNSPELGKSIGVIVWCGLSVSSAVWVSQHPRLWPLMLRVGAWAAFASAVLSIAFWAAASAGVAEVGVQIDPTYGGYASFVTSIEANVLAGLLCLWGLVAAWNPLGAIGQICRRALVLTAPIAILATHTRAALVAYVLGLVIVFVARRGARALVLGATGTGGVIGVVLLATSADSGLSKFTSLLDTSGGTGKLRLQVNGSALEEWLGSTQHLIGLGWNSFGQRHVDPTRPFLNIPGYIGNLPLQIIYDGGLLALVAVAIAVLAVAWNALRTKTLAVMVMLSVPYLLFSLSTSVLWLFETWFWVGLAWGMQERSRDVPSNDISGADMALPVTTAHRA